MKENKKKIRGIIVSDKMNTVRVVSVDLVKKHKKYHKSYIVNRKFFAKDLENKSTKGDLVVCRETKPFSKNGRWEIIKIKKNEIIEKN